MNAIALNASSSDGLLLAAFVRQRRLQLELTVADAAHLAGLEFSEWCALECGWIPSDERNTLRSVAETLMSGAGQVSLLASLSRSARHQSISTQENR